MNEILLTTTKDHMHTLKCVICYATITIDEVKCISHIYICTYICIQYIVHGMIL